MPAVLKRYSDIDLSFVPHPISGDITILRDANAVKRSLRNLMYMGKYERPFEPDVGAHLKQLLFEPINPLTEEGIKKNIIGAISSYEPRVTIIKLKVEGDFDNNGYSVTLEFVVDTISEVLTLDTFIERVR